MLKEITKLFKESHGENFKAEALAIANEYRKVVIAAKRGRELAESRLLKSAAYNGVGVDSNEVAALLGEVESSVSESSSNY